MNNLKEFNDYIDFLASEFKYSGHEDFSDYCHEAADGSQYVIYNGMAWDLVNMIRLADHAIFDDAELILENDNFDSLQSHITAMAYEIIYQQLMLALQELNEEAA
jgi:hypothetical protein